MIRERRLPSNILDRLPSLIDVLKDNEAVQALYFFGSLARRELSPLSDLDFALLLNENLNRKEIFKFNLDLIGEVSETLKTDEFDLIILNEAPLRFCYQILKTGQMVFVKDKRQLTEFREKVVKKYLDFLPNRNEFNSAFLKGIGLHG